MLSHQKTPEKQNWGEDLKQIHVKCTRQCIKLKSVMVQVCCASVSGSVGRWCYGMSTMFLSCRATHTALFQRQEATEPYTPGLPATDLSLQLGRAQLDTCEDSTNDNKYLYGH